MQKIDQKEFASRYWKSASESIYPEFGEEDLEYTWADFTEARDFLARIAGPGRSVVFLADQ